MATYIVTLDGEKMLESEYLERQAEKDFDEFEPADTDPEGDE